MKSITRKKSFEMDIPIQDLFPLFSPEGEKYWVPGWSYVNIIAEWRAWLLNYFRSGH